MCVLIIKKDKNLLPLCAKSRIVVLGNHKDHVWSKSDWYAPFLCSDSLHFLFSLAVASRCPLHQGNCKNIFCQGFPPEDEVPIVCPPSSDPDASPDKYWLLLCTLYGLRRSPRHCYNKINAILILFGLTPLLEDSVLFRFHSWSQWPLCLSFHDALISWPLHQNFCLFFGRSHGWVSLLSVISGMLQGWFHGDCRVVPWGKLFLAHNFFHSCSSSQSIRLLQWTLLKVFHARHGTKPLRLHPIGSAYLLTQLLPLWMTTTLLPNYNARLHIKASSVALDGLHQPPIPIFQLSTPSFHYLAISRLLVIWKQRSMLFTTSTQPMIMTFHSSPMTWLPCTHRSAILLLPMLRHTPMPSHQNWVACPLFLPIAMSVVVPKLEVLLPMGPPFSHFSSFAVWMVELFPRSATQLAGLASNKNALLIAPVRLKFGLPALCWKRSLISATCLGVLWTQVILCRISISLRSSTLTTRPALNGHPFRGKPPKAREPFLWMDQPTTNDQQLTAEELNYSGDRAWQHQRPTNNLLEVCKNLAIFGGRPIGTAVEALLTKVVKISDRHNHQ